MPRIVFVPSLILPPISASPPCLPLCWLPRIPALAGPVSGKHATTSSLPSCTMLAGQRPRELCPLAVILVPLPPPRIAFGVRGGRDLSSPSSVATRHPSIFSAPVPCLSTFSATVPTKGLRARQIGSHAGFNAVPQPCHWRAAAVAGRVMCFAPVLPPA